MSYLERIVMNYVYDHYENIKRWLSNELKNRRLYKRRNNYYYRFDTYHIGELVGWDFINWRYNIISGDKDQIIEYDKEDTEELFTYMYDMIFDILIKELNY